MIVPTITNAIKWYLLHYFYIFQGGKVNHPFPVELAKKYNKSPAQILIRWSLQKGFVTIPKSSDPKRIGNEISCILDCNHFQNYYNKFIFIIYTEENANVFDFSFTDEEMSKFEEIGRNFQEHCTWDPTRNDMSEFGPTK